MDVQIVIPVYRPDDKFLALLASLRRQTLTNTSLLIIDSGAEKKYRDFYPTVARVEEITPAVFDHGGTRQWALEIAPGKDVYVFLTQDAILCGSEALASLVRAFEDPSVGCAFGRQIPHIGADPFARHARQFHYGETSYLRSLADRRRYGLKTVFISDSFAAYRGASLREVGGFPTRAILGEDMYVAAKMLLSGWQLAYVAEAAVYHSHNYSPWQECKRYFDTGVFHAQEPWIRATFGAAEGEGRRFVAVEFLYLWQTAPRYLPLMALRDAMKFLGYRLGLGERFLPRPLKRGMSMNVMYWKEPSGG